MTGWNSRKIIRGDDIAMIDVHAPKDKQNLFNNGGGVCHAFMPLNIFKQFYCNLNLLGVVFTKRCLKIHS